MSERWLNTYEIAKHLGITERTVRRYIDEHGMPVHRRPGGFPPRFRASEVDAWFADWCANPETPTAA